MMVLFLGGSELRRVYFRFLYSMNQRKIENDSLMVQFTCLWRMVAEVDLFDGKVVKSSLQAVFKDWWNKYEALEVARHH